MREKLYNRIANGCFIAILALAVAAGQFPDLTPLLGGVAILIGIGAAGVYFRHRFSLVEKNAARLQDENAVDQQGIAPTNQTFAKFIANYYGLQASRSSGTGRPDRLWWAAHTLPIRALNEHVVMMTPSTRIAHKLANALQNYRVQEEKTHATPVQLNLLQDEMVRVLQNTLMHRTPNTHSHDNDYWPVLSSLLEPKPARQGQRIKVEATAGVEIVVGGTRIIVDEVGKVVIEGIRSIKPELRPVEAQLVSSESDEIPPPHGVLH